jgi:sensor histidine kinase YesM
MVLKKNISLYWKCQIIGWGLVSFYWLYISLNRDDYSIFIAICNYILDITIGITLTHIYKRLAVRYNWYLLGIKKLLFILIPTILLLAFSYMILVNLKFYYFWEYVANQNFGFVKTLLDWDPVFVTGLRLMSIWLLSYHLYNYHKRELHISKANAQLVTAAKQAQLDSLLTQLNPHFLFNCMNSIKSLIIENPSSARRSIDLLSDLLRSSLDQKDNDLITINEELQLVRDYFELEKIRYENRLEYVINVESRLEANKIPKFSVQLLVENAIKHGIDKYIQGGCISISISSKDDFIQIIVENPGKIMLNPSKGIGLKNLNERLYILFDGKAHFVIEEKAENKVAVTIIIPKTCHDKKI